MEQRSNFNSKHLRGIIVIVVLIAIVTACVLFVRKNIVPTVVDASMITVRTQVNSAINRSATNAITKYTYDELVTISRKSDDEVSNISIITPNVNLLAREITRNADETLSSKGKVEVNIPAGTFTGIALLLGVGPNVTVTATPIYAISAEFKSEFITAGINQTLHKVYIIVNVLVNMIIPFTESEFKMTSQILVCENLIVGKVPDAYLNTIDWSDALDLVPHYN